MGQAQEIFQNSVTGLAGSLTGAIGNELGYAIGNITGSNERRRREQLEQQQALTNMQQAANENLMQKSYGLQKDMWDSTNYEAQVEHAKAAGLNPAMLYAKGGSGGSTGAGGASVGGAQASDETSRLAAETAQQGMGLQIAMMKSQIEVNESIASKNKAEALAATESANTNVASRSAMVAKLYEDGLGQYLANAQERYKMAATLDNKNVKWREENNEFYNGSKIAEDSIFTRELTVGIAKAEAETGNANASALLTNTKAQGYFQELLNSTALADAAGIQAAAQKLASEYNYGDQANWKWWANYGEKIANDALTGVGKVKKPTYNTYNETTKNIEIFK